MRQFRNPRYAPESLERKLSPSAYFAPAPAEYFIAPAPAPAPAPDESSPGSDEGFATPTSYTMVAIEDPGFAAPPVEPGPSPEPSTEPNPEPSTGEPPWEAPSDPSGPREPS